MPDQTVEEISSFIMDLYMGYIHVYHEKRKESVDIDHTTEYLTYKKYLDGVINSDGVVPMLREDIGSQIFYFTFVNQKYSEQLPCLMRINSATDTQFIEAIENTRPKLELLLNGIGKEIKVQ